jgi:hypothetical protein
MMMEAMFRHCQLDEPESGKCERGRKLGSLCRLEVSKVRRPLQLTKMPRLPKLECRTAASNIFFGHLNLS